MADEALFAKLIVTDTGPLITLAAADSLDYLLYPGVPVHVPDVFGRRLGQHHTAVSGHTPTSSTA
jgi:hypothetical protein